MNYSLDTNAIIYWLKNEEKATLILQKVLSGIQPISISAIVIAELFSYSDLSQDEQWQINDITSTMTIVPLDSRIAQGAGFLRKIYGIKIADSVIAATALSTGSTLITRNIKDFKNIPNLNLLEI